MSSISAWFLRCNASRILAMTLSILALLSRDSRAMPFADSGSGKPDCFSLTTCPTTSDAEKVRQTIVAQRRNTNNFFIDIIEFLEILSSCEIESLIWNEFQFGKL